jgi:multiple sugar transport system ATP-binding protein
MSEVRLDRVRKAYDNGHVAVKDASFEAKAGELLVLVGPSGCGKSTLLRLIAGLEALTEGTLSIGGRVVNDVPSKDRDVAMVFQSYALYHHMSVADNLGFGLKLRKLPAAEIEQRVRAAAEKLGLAGVLSHRPGMLSGGQRQRVALGRAIVRNPRVFLLDEPLSNLDAKLRLSTRIEIARLQRSLQATMIYVTHDQVEAMTMGDRIVIMNNGEIQQVGAPMDVYDHPGHMFVAGFIGSPAMNFFQGKLTAQNSDLFVDLGKFAVKLPKSQVNRFGTHVNQRVVFGIRPENISDREEAGEHQQERVPAKVNVVEPLGSEVIVELSAGDHTFVGRLDPTTTARPMHEMAVYFDMGRFHLFDAETGINLTRQ